MSSGSTHALEGAYGVLPGAEDVEDPVHAHEFEHGAHLLRHAAQFQVAAPGVQLPQAGDKRAQPELSTKRRRERSVRLLQILVRFARQVLAFRRAHAVPRREAFYDDRDILWFDPSGRSPDWLDPGQKRLACLVHGYEAPDLYLMFNADGEPTSFVLPALAPSRGWRLAIDTAQPSAGEFDAAERMGVS